MYNCQRCGKPTSGAYSMGGLLWAICEDCMADDHRSIADRAALDSDIHREIAAQKRGTPESLERFWQTLPAWKVDQLRG